MLEHSAILHAVPLVPTVLPLHAAACYVHPRNKQTLSILSLLEANWPFLVCTEKRHLLWLENNCGLRRGAKGLYR